MSRIKIAMINQGRPSYDEEKYQTWLRDLEPFLKSGMSLYGAVGNAGLISHKDSIYRKYRLNDWFCEKVTVFQSYTGELVNMIFVKRIELMYQNVLEGKPLNKEDVKLLRLAVDKHRSCQEYFISKYEISKKRQTNIKELIESL